MLLAEAQSYLLRSTKLDHAQNVNESRSSFASGNSSIRERVCDSIFIPISLQVPVMDPFSKN
jgi:hypothetical protein